MSEAVVRFPKFAARLSAACDEHPDCPPLHKGRQVWLRAQLAQEGLFVSVEGIRKWLAGESRPKEENTEKLARVLAKDAHWLRTGQLLQVAAEPDDVKSAPYSLAPSLTIGLRPSLSVDIRGLPMDLTKSEAARLGAVLSAWATVS